MAVAKLFNNPAEPHIAVPHSTDCPVIPYLKKDLVYSWILLLSTHHWHKIKCIHQYSAVNQSKTITICPMLFMLTATEMLYLAHKIIPDMY